MTFTPIFTSIPRSPAPQEFCNALLGNSLYFQQLQFHFGYFYVNLVCMLTCCITGLLKSTPVIQTVPQTPRNSGNVTKSSDELNLIGVLPSSVVMLALDHSTAALVFNSVTIQQCNRLCILICFVRCVIFPPPPTYEQRIVFSVDSVRTCGQFTLSVHLFFQNKHLDTASQQEVNRVVEIPSLCVTLRTFPSSVSMATHG